MRLRAPDFTTEKKKIIFACILAGAAAAGAGCAIKLLSTAGEASASPVTASYADNSYYSGGDGSFIEQEEDGGTFISASNNGLFYTAEESTIEESEPIVFTPRKKADVIESESTDDEDLFGEYGSLNPSGGEGWQEINGSVYFYRSGEPIKGWMHLESGEGRYCYFSDDDGHMLKNTITPDGYFVGKDGIYILPQKPSEKQEFEWDKDRDTPESVSGIMIGGKPAEFYMLSIAGENSGLVSNSAGVGDKGRGYGPIGFDYRAALVPFMNYAYNKNPSLWEGFQPYLNCRAGDASLIGNDSITNTFTNAMRTSFREAVADQLTYGRMYCFDNTEAALRNAGIDLDARPAAVGGAIFSVSVNCGQHPSLFAGQLSNDMSDEEMIKKIYELRNTVLAEENVGSVKKGTTTRYMEAEPEMALDLLYGIITIDSDAVYGGGVEWHGNPFGRKTSAKPVPESIGEDSEKEVEKPTEAYSEPETAAATSSPVGPGTGTGENSYGPGAAAASASVGEDRAEIIARASGETQ